MGRGVERGGPVIVLDTHIWIWHAANSPKLGKAMRSKLNKADALGVPAIACWELAMLEAKGRLALTQPARTWIQQALALPGVGLLPLSPEIAWLSMNLPGEFHGDPADRMIVATALHLRLPLATMDQQIVTWGKVKLV